MNYWPRWISAIKKRTATLSLAGESVCGLHVPWNLRVVTASENVAKGALHD